MDFGEAIKLLKQGKRVSRSRCPERSRKNLC